MNRAPDSYSPAVVRFTSRTRHRHREFDSVVEPVDIYGITKQQGEVYVRALAAARGLSAVIVRLFNVIGPGETNPHLLPAIVAQLREARTPSS